MNEQAIQRASTSKTLADYLKSPAVSAKLAEVAGKHMKAEDLTRLALMALNRQPELARCSQVSILRALMDAASLGIKPGGTMGRGYLVPRKNRATGDLECCFDPGWRGLVDIARRSGKVKSIESHVVYSSDKFRISYGLNPVLEHVPDLQGDQGTIVAAYAIAVFHDGATQVEVMSLRDLEKIRKSSASQGGPWSNWFDEMARKSVVKRLCKYLPFDEALEAALGVDAEDDAPSYAGPSIEVPTEAPQVAEPKRTKALADKIRASAPKVEADADGVIVEPQPEPVAAMREPGED